MSQLNREMNLMNSLNYFFFVIFPYISIAVFLVGTIYRYTTRPGSR